MVSSRRRTRHRRRISRAVKRNPIVAGFLHLLWPRTTVPTSPAALRAERYQAIGFGLALLALLIATTVIFFQGRSEGARPIDVDSASE